eukprot:m.305651 g.305651  ORF g.305651 m.305651 type:complete len:116 (-) comp15910_c2_seq1:1421-1768(-)
MMLQLLSTLIFLRHHRGTCTGLDEQAASIDPALWRVWCPTTRKVLPTQLSLPLCVNCLCVTSTMPEMSSHHSEYASRAPSGIMPSLLALLVHEENVKEMRRRVLLKLLVHCTQIG